MTKNTTDFASLMVMIYFHIINQWFIADCTATRLIY